MGDQDDLGTVLLGEAQRVHHVAGRAGVGDEEQHILGAHQAGRDGLHVAVAAVRNLVEIIEKRAQMSSAST